MFTKLTRIKFVIRTFEMLSYPFATQSVVWNLVSSTLIMCPSIVSVLFILRSKVVGFCRQGKLYTSSLLFSSLLAFVTQGVS